MNDFEPGPGTFLRTFLIQASFNDRTMVGGGFAFSLLPTLRRKGSEAEEPLPEALSRHLEGFNAHPYLAGAAVAAVAKLEAAGQSPETIGRFKEGLRSALGGLGDRIVWAGWLPLCVLGAIAAWTLGAAVGWSIGGFLLLYNAGHLFLRWEAFRLGRREGLNLGRRLREIRPARLGRPLSLAVAFALGLTAGGFGARALTALPDAGSAGPLLWCVAGAAFFLIGVRGGVRAARWGAGLVAALFLGIVLGASLG